MVLTFTVVNCAMTSCTRKSRLGQDTPQSFVGMSAQLVFVAADGDGIGRKIGAARLRNDIAEIRQTSQAIERGNQAFCGWALATGGLLVRCGRGSAVDWCSRRSA